MAEEVILCLHGYVLETQLTCRHTAGASVCVHTRIWYSVSIYDVMSIWACMWGHMYQASFAPQHMASTVEESYNCSTTSGGLPEAVPCSMLAISRSSTYVSDTTDSVQQHHDRSGVVVRKRRQ